jgi:hypothetical protein
MRNVADRVSQPCKTTGKIIVLYTIIFTVLVSRWEDKDSEPCSRKHSPNLVCS